MTPEEAKVAWYREMAERFSAIGWMVGDDGLAHLAIVDSVEMWFGDSSEVARVAAHFGRLAIGEPDGRLGQAMIRQSVQRMLEAEAQLAIALGALADIGTSADLTLVTARKKARRIYHELSPTKETA